MAFCDECCNKPCRCYVTPEYEELMAERNKLKARVERLTKILNYVEEALASSEEPWLREAHQVIKQALAEQEGK